jgi:hypothetical protein
MAGGILVAVPGASTGIVFFVVADIVFHVELCEISERKTRDVGVMKSDCDNIFKST